MSNSTTRWALGALTVAMLAFAAPAQAQYSGGYQLDPRVQGYSDFARDRVGDIYGHAGRRVCGSACASGARRFGEGFYDRSQQWSTHNGRRLQEFGRNRVRPWIEDNWGPRRRR